MVYILYESGHELMCLSMSFEFGSKIITRLLPHLYFAEPMKNRQTRRFHVMMYRDTLVLVFFSDLHDSEHKAELFELNIVVERHGKLHPYVKKLGLNRC